MYMINNLCQTLIRLSVRTWNALRLGGLVQISLEETTITEVNLLEMQLNHPTQVTVHKFSQAVEGKRTGADWEWWIGRTGQWLGLRVQAKKLTSSSRTYENLDHTSVFGRQVDLLTRDAAANDLYPLYCFYNYWQYRGTTTWNCPNYPRTLPLLGCAIADARAVEIRIRNGMNRLRDVLPISLPWSCLACCPDGLSYGAPLERRVASVLTDLPERRQEIPRFHERLPDYVERILAGQPPDVERPDVPYLLVFNTDGEAGIEHLNKSYLE